MSCKKRVLIIGIDGASFEIINPLLEDEKLPTFQQILRQGTFCKFQSVLPSNSATGWTSLLTGKNSGKHNIFDFYDKTNGTYKRNLINNETVKSERIWDILGNYDQKSILMNLPATYPPYPINGMMVSGMLTPRDEVFTYPKQLTDKLNQQKYTIDIFDHFCDTLDGYMELAIQVMTKRQQAFLNLLQRHSWDFSTVVFTTPERLQNTIWNQKSEIQKLYIILDQLIGEIIDKVQDENTYVIIVSNYGFRSISRKFFVNEWLSELGLLTKYISTERASISDILEDHYDNNGKQKYIANFLAKTGITKDNIRSVLPTEFCELIKRITPASIRKLFPKENLIINWEKTKAFFPTRYSNGIRINLQGREPGGIVKPGWEYENVRDTIIRELYRLKDPHTFENVVDHVFKREQLFHGTYAPNAPDIVFTTRNFNYVLEPNKRTSRLSISNSNDDYPVYSGYDSNGFLLVTGPTITKDKRNLDISIYDIAPTVLDILDVPVPKDFDGKIVHDLHRKDDYDRSNVLGVPHSGSWKTDFQYRRNLAIDGLTI